MTKEDLLKIVLAALLAGFIRPIIDAFMPSKDKIKVYIIKALNIFFSYLVPIGFLIFTFLDKTPVDKFFLFKILLFSIILVVNINLGIFFKVKSDIDSARSFFTQHTIDTLKDLIDVIKGNQMHLDVTSNVLKLAQDEKKLIDEKFATLEKKVKKIEDKKVVKKI
jgi:hypothetical protein